MCCVPCVRARVWGRLCAAGVHAVAGGGGVLFCRRQLSLLTPVDEGCVRDRGLRARATGAVDGGFGGRLCAGDDG